MCFSERQIFLGFVHCGVEGGAGCRRHETTPPLSSPNLLVYVDQLPKNSVPKKTVPSRGSPAVKPQFPGQRRFQGQVQVMRQLLEAQLAQPHPLAVQHRVGAEEHEAQHQD